ncbi:MAG: GNAT family N-acetyltransferase [Alphaproteobacteria bacterium]|nr:GNAT family N-acetyltransferase [Alphaproteobacteria bacterium]
MNIRRATADDRDAVWRVIEPIIRAGETYPVALDATKDQGLAYWFDPKHEVFVAEEDGAILGCYYIKANTGGPGDHVANCGYMVSPLAWGKGVGRALCMHSLQRARERGFRAMQFNLVISTNARAVHLWQSCGFEIVGRLPGAFRHPTQGYVDALILFQAL